MKTCTKCKIAKDEINFSPKKSQCKECIKAYNTQWAEKNAHKFKEYNKKSNKTWYQKNTEKCRQGQKQRRELFPEEYNARAAIRRATKFLATPKWCEKAEIRALFKQAKLLSEITGIPHHVDHIVPLKSDIVQGLHCLANLQVIPAVENLAKSNQIWPNMP